MKYIDMHCDTLTECVKLGGDMFSCALQTDIEKLKKSGCAAQCFAIFTQGDNASGFFAESLNFYQKTLDKHKDKILPVKCADDLKKCVDGNMLGSILTVENLGFTDGDLSWLPRFSKAGVKMASLVWNVENEYAYPNLIFKGEMPAFELREMRGLTPLGREAVEILDSLGIITDISHLSDGGAEEILRGRKTPVVASHSNAAGVCGVSRNLTDGQISKIADCGGVIGVNFCKDFLGDGDTFDCVFRHIKHILKIGGEDVLAFGSDFDGIPAPPDLEDCTRMPALLNYLAARGINGRILDKMCRENFIRVFKEVCG